MAAPTNTADVKKALANSEPATHGPSRQILRRKDMYGIEREAEMLCARNDEFDPAWT